MIINGEVFVINGCLMLIPSFFLVIETVIKCKRNDTTSSILSLFLEESFW